MNDGETWTDVKTDAEGAMRSVVFAGDTGFATSTGSLLRSLDGGQTWRRSPTEGIRWYDLAFAGRTAIAVGGAGLVARTKDAGLSWSAVSSPARTHLRAVAFASPTEGLAVGFWGEAIRTSDGGASWTRERTGTRMHLMAVTARPGSGFLVSGTRETVFAVTPEGAR